MNCVSLTLRTHARMPSAPSLSVGSREPDRAPLRAGVELHAGDPIVYRISHKEKDAVVLGIDREEFWIYVYDERKVVRSHISHVGLLDGRVYVVNGEWGTPVDQALCDLADGNRTLFDPCRNKATLENMNNQLKVFVDLLRT